VQRLTLLRLQRKRICGACWTDADGIAELVLDDEAWVEGDDLDDLVLEIGYPSAELTACQHVLLTLPIPSVTFMPMVISS
jgi:hypothetical protein